MQYFYTAFPPKTKDLSPKTKNLSLKTTNRLFFSALTVLFLIVSVPAQAQLDGSGIAPDFTLGDVKGNMHQLYSYLDDNKIVVLDFFAVWCGNCQATAPELERINKKWGPEGAGAIVMLSLEADDASTDNQVNLYAAQYGATNPHINSTKEVPGLYKVNYYPTFYVIAPDRSYVLVNGTSQVVFDEMEEAIKAAPLLRTVSNDIRVRGYVSPRGAYCTNAIQPRLELQNFGNNDIQQFSMEVFSNGASLGVFNFSDLIPSYQLYTVTFPWLTDLATGWHDFSVEVLSVNGAPDGDPDNDQVSGDFKVVENGQKLKVEMFTDGYPQESWWEIREGDRLIADKQRYAEAFKWQSDEVCIDQQGCYTFTLYDRFNDGIGGGQLKVSLGETVLVHIDRWTFMGGSVKANFCLPGTSGLDPQLNLNQIQLFPNPASSEVVINLPAGIHENASVVILDQLGRERTTIRQITAETISLDTKSLESGLYYVRISSAEGIFVHKLIIKQ